MSRSISGRRFVLTPYGSAGDVYPFLWLGKELRAQGASVVVVASPVFKDAVERCGLRLVPVGTPKDFHDLAKNPDFWHPVKGPWLVLCSSKRWFGQLSDIIAALLRPSHSVLISSAPNFPATFAALKMRRPRLTVHLQPVAVFSAQKTPLMGAGFGWFRKLPLPLKKLFLGMPTPVDFFYRSTLRRLCTEAGISTPSRLFVDWWDSPQGVLCLFPKWFAEPADDWPVQLVQTNFPLFDPLANNEAGRGLEPGLEEFLNTGPKPVIFTAGSAMGCAEKFFSAAREAIADIGERAVFVTAYGEKIVRPLPPGIFVARYASFSSLFPRAKAAVHHGGIGTTAQALAAGIPQLIVPHSHDQPDNAERLGRLGCAMTIPAPRLTPGRLASGLHTLLNDPLITARALEIAKLLPPPGVASPAMDAVAEIRRFLFAKPEAAVHNPVEQG